MLYLRLILLFACLICCDAQAQCSGGACSIRAAQPVRNVVNRVRAVRPLARLFRR